MRSSALLCRATLVICPVSLVGQWLEEAKSKLDGSLRLYMYHGGNRIRDAKRLATDYDIVVTTYQVHTQTTESSFICCKIKCNPRSGC